MSIDELLAAGRYAQIPRGDDPHALAVWAFARFHLAPDQESAQAAEQAHQAGELLGTFICLLSQRCGAGVRHDEAVMDRLNFQLRTRLEAIASPSGLELYMLSQCRPGNEAGIVQFAHPSEGPAFYRAAAQERWKRLRQAAELGVAQACAEMGYAFQHQNDFPQAYQWFRRAGDQGLGEGKRGAGFLTGRGQGVKQDPIAEAALAREAAEVGDAFAMINLAVLYYRGVGVPGSSENARQWLDRAAETGHWGGLLEKGHALFLGNYDYPIDEALGKEFLRRAVRTGHSDLLLRLARYYAEGSGVRRDIHASIRFAEAAFRQGNRDGARALSAIYQQRFDDLAPNKELSQFWAIQAKTDMAYAVGPALADSPLLQRIQAIDPFSVAVE
jgi:TPR repeat protein